MTKTIIAGLLFFISPIVSAAEVTIPVDYNRSSMGIVSSLIFSIGYGSNETTLFETTPLRKADKGKSYPLYSAEDDPQFTAFVARLTDGRDDTLYFTYRGGATFTETAPESDYFSKTSGPYSPDIGAQRINSITLTVDDLDFNLTVIWIGIPLFRTAISFKAHVTISYHPAYIPAVVSPLLSH